MTPSDSFYAQEDLLPEGETAAKIRVLIIRHLHSIPHHPYCDMEQQLAIKKLVHTQQNMLPRLKPEKDRARSCLFLFKIAPISSGIAIKF
jgi:hypothetical protein